MRHLKKLAAISAAAGLYAHAAPAQQMLTAETAAPGGAPYITITTLGELAAEAGIADMQVLDGQTLTNTLQNVAEGKTMVGAAPFVLPFLMQRGAGAYASLGAEKGAELVKNVQVLFTYRLGGFALYAYNSAGISGWDGLEGKTIINGPPRGGALTNGRALIKIVAGLDDGEGYQGLQVNWGQMVKTITDGSADAMVLPWYFPDTRATLALAAGDMTAWSVPIEAWETEAMQQYLKSPGSAPFVIDLADVAPQDGLTVVSEDGIWRSPATVGGNFVQASMDEETAYQLTKLVVENIDRMKAKAAFMPLSALGSTDPAVTGMCGANPLKYHPGAVRAWEEAGHTIPDCAKP